MNYAVQSYLQNKSNVITEYNFKTMLTVMLGFVFITTGVIVRPVMYIAALFVVVSIILTKSIEELCCLLFGWMNVATIFKLSPQSTSLFTYIELLCVVLLLIRTRRIDGKFLVSWMLYSIYLLLGVGTQYGVFLKVTIVPLMLYFIVRSVSELGVKRLSTYYVLGVFIQSFLGLFKLYIPNMSNFVISKATNISYSVAGGYTQEERFSGLAGDPNYYSIFLILSLAVCIYYFVNDQLKEKHFYLIAGFIAIFGGLTGSKTFVLMFVIAIIFLFFALIQRRQYRRMGIFVILGIVGGILIFSGIVNIFSLVIQRINSGTIDLTTGRIAIWKEYIQLLSGDVKMLLLGNGIGGGYPGHVAHNFYLDCLIICGVAGSILFISTLSLAVGRLERTNDFSRKIPLIMLLMLYFSLSMFFQYELTFQVAIVVLILKWNHEKNNILCSELY